jgi:hypothetical protein
VRGEKGVVAVVNRREKRRMEELTRYGPSTAACATGGTPPTVGQRGSRGHRLGGRGATARLGGGCCTEGGLTGRPEQLVHGGAQWTGVGDGKHEEENVKGKPSA